jgi:hypothetical protein
MKTDTVADMKKVFKKAAQIIRKEPEYVHNAFSRLVGRTNCYCTLGAVGKAIGGTFCKKETDGWIRVFGWRVKELLENRLRNSYSVRKTLAQLSDPAAPVDKKQSLKAIALFNRSILKKEGGK